MSKVTIKVNGRQIDVEGDSTVAAALLASDHFFFRTSVSGSPRAPLCGMGICFECRVSIDGVRHQRSCQIAVRNGMSVQTE